MQQPEQSILYRIAKMPEIREKEPSFCGEEEFNLTSMGGWVVVSP